MFSIIDFIQSNKILYIVVASFLIVILKMILDVLDKILNLKMGKKGIIRILIYSVVLEAIPFVVSICIPLNNEFDGKLQIKIEYDKKIDENDGFDDTYDMSEINIEIVKKDGEVLYKDCCDNDGEYSVSLNYGSYELNVYSDGYKPYHVDLELTPDNIEGDRWDKDILLESDNESINSVIETEDTFAEVSENDTKSEYNDSEILTTEYAGLEEKQSEYVGLEEKQSEYVDLEEKQSEYDSITINTNEMVDLYTDDFNTETEIIHIDEPSTETFIVEDECDDMEEYYQDNTNEITNGILIDKDIVVLDACLYETKKIYEKEIDEILSKQNGVQFSAYGIRFDSPIKIIADGIENDVLICEVIKSIDIDENDLLEKKMKYTGYFERVYNRGTFSEDGIYLFYPYDFAFVIVGCEEID